MKTKYLFFWAILGFIGIVVLLVVKFQAKPSPLESLHEILANSDLRNSVSDFQVIQDGREATYAFRVDFLADAPHPFLDRPGFSIEENKEERRRILDNAKSFGLGGDLRADKVEVLKGLDACGLWMEVLVNENYAVVFAHRM